MGRLWGFALYGVVVIIHLAVLLIGADAWEAPTKASLMPALLVALLVGMRPLRSEATVWAGLGVLFAWAGDVLLGRPGETGFLVGLACFLLAHVAYLVLYVRPLRRRRPPWWVLGFAAWWAALVVVLLPWSGALTLPLLVYGALLCAAAALAWGTTPLVGTGATLFLVSDTLLALRMFVPGFGFPQQDVVIMAFYTAGQGLIVLGAVLAVSRAAGIRTIEERTDT